MEYELKKPAPNGSGLQGIKNNLLASLKKRFSNIEDSNLYCYATLLDPRFKDMPFRAKNLEKIAKNKLLNRAQKEKSIYSEVCYL